MATVTTTSTLDGNFKRIYAPKLENLIPENAKLIKAIKFGKNKRLGDTYEQPVKMTNCHGATYATAGSGAFTLNSPITLSTVNARVPSNQLIIRDRIDYESASKSSSGGDAAFINATSIVVKTMMTSMVHRLECGMLYGGTGIGLATTASSANASATSTVVTISDATWAMGIWAGAENATLNFYNGSTVIGGATYDAADSVYTITSVDVDNKAITVSATSTGITALDSEISTSAASVRAYWYGSYGNEMNGIDKIMTNTGTLFGISAATYQLWKSNTYAVSGAITLSHVLKSTTSAIGKGGLDGEVICYLAPQNFAVLNAEVAAYRRLDSSYKSSGVDYGHSELQMYAQNGLMRIVPHSMVKGGEGFIFPLDCIKRIGSTDITFENPGVGGRIFRELTDSAGFELRTYSDQAIFIDKPAVCTKLTGITY
jgi:hypothetical protein